jgi:hypothetical protein
MRALLLPCFAVCSLALSGCSAVYSAHPLSTNEDAVEEPALEGIWTDSDDDKAQFCIQKSDAHAYNMTIVDPDSKLTAIYRIDLVRLNDLLFADMVFQKMAIDRTQIEPPLGTISNHVIVKLDISEDVLTYFPMDSRAIQNQNGEGYSQLEFISEGDVMLLTTSTQDLRQYLSGYSEKVFSDSGHLTRKIDDGTPGTSTMTCGLPTPP